MPRLPLGLALAALVAAATPVLAACPAGARTTAIAAVQGDGPSSPLTGRAVTVRGVVTAAFPGADGLEGFFLQDAAGDGDPATSDGLFVRIAGGVRSPAPGDAVRVAGTVRETGGMTQLGSVTRLERCGSAVLPPPRVVRLPVHGPAAWEALEGMLVTLPGPLVVTDVYPLARDGELELAAARLFVSTQGAGATASAQRGIVLDDGSRKRDPAPVPYLLEAGRPPRVGDSVRDVTAVVMGAGSGRYRLEPVGAPRLVPTNPRPDAPAPVGGALRVATFNVHNFFTTLGERGARSAGQRALQRSKLAAALAGLGADAIALQEVESDGMRSENALLKALNARLGSNAYAAVPDPAGGVGGDRIKQAVLYRPSALELLSSASDPRPLFERAPVAATFRQRGGGVFTLVALHLKSKGGCPAAGDVDRGYGCWNLRRSAQAQAVLDFVAALRRATGDGDVLVAGDLNSYAAEPPLRLLESAGFVDASRSVPAPERYSYVYQGRSGTLDYLLASATLAPQLAGAAIWHIDADESALVGAFGRASSFAPAPQTPYRASDHDPVLVGLALTKEKGSGAASQR